MYPNPLKQRLRNGEIILGTGGILPSPHLTGAILDTGPDFIWIDTEHLPYGSEAKRLIDEFKRTPGAVGELLCLNRGLRNGFTLVGPE